MKKIVQLFNQYREMIAYLFFGGATTLVNIVGYWFFTRVIHLESTPANITALGISILFAYITNKLWVFESKTESPIELLKEMGAFFGCRAITGALDVAIMYIFVKRLLLPDMIFKIITNVIVIIANYVASKLFIFKKQAIE